MALTEIYVDPSIAGDSGAGTIGDPYGDLEYAIEQETFDTTNGTRVNILAGTDEILAASLQAALADTSVSIAWVPAEAAPLVFQGYGAVAGDGSIGGITGSTSGSIMDDATLDYVNFIDLHLHTCGANPVLSLDNYCSVIRCEIDNATGGGVLLDAEGLISECYIHNIAGIGAETLTGGFIMFNYMANGTNKFTKAISTQNSPRTIYRNIIKLDGASDGIQVSQGDLVLNNSIWSDGGTGQGMLATANQLVASITNNIVEGFSGAGGVGYDLDDGTCFVRVYGGNSAYNNTTDFQDPGGFLIDDVGGNEVLTASPFTDAANGDFSPVDTGSVKEGSLPASIGNGNP